MNSAGCEICGDPDKHHAPTRQHFIAHARLVLQMDAQGFCPCGQPKDHKTRPTHPEAMRHHYLKAMKRWLDVEEAEANWAAATWPARVFPPSGTESENAPRVPQLRGVGRPSTVAVFAPQIETWLREDPDLSAADILRRMERSGYRGSQSALYDLVRQLRGELGK